MKIAVSGTAGIGKTTLAAALAELLGVTCVPESYEPFFDQPASFSRPAGELVELFVRVFDEKSRLERDAGDFVVDRCPIDLFHLWMTYGPADDQVQTRLFHDRCLKHARGYDFVVLPAWGSIPLRQKDDAPNHQRRVMNPWVQLRNHAAIAGYTHLWLPAGRIIQLPMPLSDHDQRVRFVLEQIKTRLELAQAEQSGGRGDR